MHFNALIAAIVAFTIMTFVTAMPNNNAIEAGTACASRGIQGCSSAEEIVVCVQQDAGLYWQHGKHCIQPFTCHQAAGEDPECRVDNEEDACWDCHDHYSLHADAINSAARDIIAADHRGMLEAKELEMKQAFEYEAMAKRDGDVDPDGPIVVRSHTVPEPPCRVEGWYRCRTEKDFDICDDGPIGLFWRPLGSCENNTICVEDPDPSEEVDCVPLSIPLIECRPWCVNAGRAKNEVIVAQAKQDAKLWQLTKKPEAAKEDQE